MAKREVKIKQPVTKRVAKVPVVMQMEALECGAASLTMILAYYGKWIPLEQVRSDCGVSRDGSNAKNVLRAARSYGLSAKGYRYEPETLKREGKFPCIVHWNFNHFVVLDGFKGKKAYLNDPAKGSYSVSMETFDESFTGICLMFEPEEGFEPGGKQKSMMAYAKKRLKGSGTAVAFVVMTSMIASLMGIINPAFSRIFLDRLLTAKNPEWVVPYFTALAGMGVIQLIVTWINAVYSLRINGKMAVVGYPADVSYENDEVRENEEYSKLSGCVEMKSVTFGYSRLAEPLIKDFNLTLKPGSRVTFVGTSGCGKSTLAKLISGLYQPWSGEILFDGKAISEIDRSAFTGSLAVVDQDIILYHLNPSARFSGRKFTVEKLSRRLFNLYPA